MAQCVSTPQEFVQNAFNPVIAVLCTSKVESLCQKNNLSFVELVQPFCKLNAEVHIRDPTNQSYPIKSLRLNLVYMNDEPPKQLEARKMLYDVVLTTMPSSLDRIRMISVDNYSLQINTSTPWFEAYREWYLKVAPISDHEFTSHFLAFIMVASADDSEVMIEFARMSQEQHNHQYQTSGGKISRWFFNNPLKYYVLVQDVAEHDQVKTEHIYQSMKSTYGANACHLLRINSRDIQTSSFCFQDPQSNLPDPWSQFLARKPTIGSEIDESTFTASSPVDGPDNISASVNISNPEGLDHPLMAHHFKKQSLSNVAIELSDDMDSSLPLGHVQEESLANMTLNPESVANEPVGSSLASGRKSGNLLPHGACMTTDDTDRIRLFMQEFSMRALLPYIEKQMSVLNEQVTNRKGLHRSFFSATKKWFGANKPAPTVGNKTAPTASIYSADSVELLVRHLGDLAFMFQHYELAYQAYHSLKRDFNSDQAWMHYSGALEMAALSVFMQGSSSQRQVPFHYLDTAINIYLNTCRSNASATRATFLAADCLKYYERYLEAANYFVRLTSEESDLRSAVLLEQAAHCHLNLNNVNIRKYAFYLILAGHRFNKAGQKRHALRCYKQALQVYQEKQWMLAEDHINLTTGRLSFTLNYLEDAIASFCKLLYDGSMQGVNQQMYYLREYLVICSHWLQQNENKSLLPRMPIPVINGQEAILLLGKAGQVPENDDVDCDFETDGNVSETIWCQLEEALIIRATGSVPLTHRPMLQRYTNFTNNSKHPLAVIGEAITLLLPIRNPLNIPLMVTDVHLTWSFQKSDNSQEIFYGDADSAGVVETKVVPEVAFNGLQVLTIRLSVIPLQTGQLRFQGIAFNLKFQNGNSSNALGDTNITMDNETTTYVSVRGTQPLSVKGSRLNQTKEERCGVVYSQDLRLEPTVLAEMPKLKVKFKNFQKSLYCGQVNSFICEITNCGSAAVKRIFLATTSPEMLAFGRLHSNPIEPLTEVYSRESDVKSVGHTNGVFEILFPEDVSVIPPGGCVWLPCWIQGSQQPGINLLNLLFYYESPASNATEKLRPRYRTLRLSTTLTLSEVVSACAIAITGPQPVGSNLQQNVTLAVEASNISSIDSTKSIKLLQVSCVSRRWSAEPLPNSAAENLNVNAKQSWKLCFRAVMRNIESDIKNDLKFSDISLVPSQKINSKHCPCECFFNSSLKNYNQDQEEKMDTKEETFVLCLILIWQCLDESTNEISFGQHHIIIKKLDCVHFAYPEKSGLPLTPNRNSVTFTLEDAANDFCLRYYIFSPGDVKHDFSISRACIVPVFLVFYNDTRFEVEIEVDANRLLNQNNLIAKREIGRFSWIGCCRTIFQIKSKETKVICLQGCFFDHGTYSLNTIGVTARSSEVNNNHAIIVKGSAQLQMIWDISQNCSKPHYS